MLDSPLVPLFFLLLIAAPRVTFADPSPAAAAHDAPSSPSETGCPALIDSLHRQFAEANPAFLFVDVGGSTCTPEQKHDAHYHQGLGFLILQKPEMARLHLQAALDHPGAFREEAWYQFWKAANAVQDKASADRAVIGLYEEFPASAHLVEMISATPYHASQPADKADEAGLRKKNPPTKAANPWKFGTQHQVIAQHEPGYARDYTEHRLQGGWRMKRGDFIFNPTVQTGLVGDFDGPYPWAWEHAPEVSSVNGETALNVLWRRLFATATLGFSHDWLRREFSDFAGSDMENTLAGWNFPQAGLSLGARLPLGRDDASLMIFGSGNRFHRDFHNLSVHASAALDGEAISHSLSAGLERLFLNTPASPEIDSTHFEPIPPETRTTVTHMNGLWGYEGEYALNWHRGKWRGSFSALLREERRVLREGADSVQVVSNIDTTMRFTFGGDAAAIERRASAAVGLVYEPAKFIALRASLRGGYMQVTSRHAALENRGPFMRLVLGLATTF